MATQQEVARGSKKYEDFVDRQLTRAGKRVRQLDLLTTGLLFLVGTLAYTVLIFGLDLWLGLDPLLRLSAFVVFGLAALGFGAVTLWQFLRLRVNPYYAARQLEKTLPDAKGSVVNWLDLREEQLPAAIRQTINHRAARDVAEADVERAIDSSATLWLSVAAVALFIPVLIIFLMGPGRFLSLVQRAFLPFQEVQIASRTDITLLKPEGGNLTIPPGQKVLFRVQVGGYVPRVNQPDSLRLRYRYNQNDPHIEQPLEEDVDGAWGITLPGDQVQNGFWYHITGGDGRTPEYQVRVVSIPQVLRWEVLYKPRAYQAVPARKVVYPNERAIYPVIKDYAGTDVVLTVQTNRVLHRGELTLDIDQKPATVEGFAVPADPKALEFRFRLQKSGTFTVRFTSKEGEANADISPHNLEVLTDLTPRVELTKPGQDIKLPANGLLPLEGLATDDLGVKLLQLQMKVVKGDLQSLKAYLYREGKFPVAFEGRYPDRVEYRDIVDLKKVENSAGQLLQLQTGWELEYWLEAIDNSDYPSKTGNVGRSKAFKVLLTEPEMNKEKQKQEREKAKQKQQEHQKQQDQQEAQRQEKEKQEREKQDQQKGQKGEQQTGEKGAQQKDFEKQADDLKKKLDELEKQGKDRSEAKGEQGKPEPQAKEGKGEPTPGELKKDGPKQEQQAADNKDGPKENSGQPQGGQQSQAKDGGEQPPQKADEQKGQARNQGQQQPESQAKSDKKDGQCSECKGGQGQNNSQAKQGGQENGEKQAQAKAEEQQGGPNQQPQGAAKKDGQQGSDNQPAQAKDDKQGPQGGAGEQQPATAKKDGQQGGGQQQSPAQAKQDQKAGGQQAAEKKDGGADRQSQPGSNAAAAKGQPEQGPRAEPKGGGTGQQQGQQAAQAKKGNEGQAGSPPGERKQGPNQGEPRASARGERERNLPDELKRSEQKEPSLDDLAKLQKKLKDDLQRRDEQDRDDLLQELERLGKEAKNKEVRDAANQLAQEAREQMAKTPPKQEGQPGTNTAGHQPGNEPGQQAKQQGNPGQGNQNPTSSKGSNDSDGGKALTATKEFGKKGGDLQLEELRRRLTPEMLRKLNWSQEDLQRFQQQARAYEQWLRQQGRTQGVAKNGQPGDGTSQLPSQAPRQIGAGPTSERPVDPGHVQPPPEFREALRLLTGGAR